MFNEFQEILKPIKPHKCEWCHQPILVGESHLKFVGHWEGEFQNWRIHHECKLPMNASDAYEDNAEICSGPHGRGEDCVC